MKSTLIRNNIFKSIGFRKLEHKKVSLLGSSFYVNWQTLALLKFGMAWSCSPQEDTHTLTPFFESDVSDQLSGCASNMWRVCQVLVASACASNSVPSACAQKYLKCNQEVIVFPPKVIKTDENVSKIVLRRSVTNLSAH